jgi:tRNA-splicing ligase RtcB
MWLDDIEEGALQQAKDLANLPFAFKHIAIMPDSHQGYGMPIGGVLATKGNIIPNAVGVDIGCGMTAIKSDIENLTEDELKNIMGKIREVIPVGFDHNKEPQKWDGFKNAPDIEVIQKELQSASHQLGTLGGGNHFIEIQKGDDGFIWIMIHSGSRNFGFKAAKTYHEKAKKLCEQWFSNIPCLDLAFLPLETTEAKEYFEAMNFCLEFAYQNRENMLFKIMDIMGEHFPNCVINIHHNYAVMEHHFGQNVLVHRKGATLARKGTIGIIPGSMGTNSYIVEGLGNSESFNSCSHGAGRRMGRAEATRKLSLEEEQEKMNGIIGGPRTQSELEEAPGAYKDIDAVMEQQSDLVKIVTKLKPLAVIKG